MERPLDWCRERMLGRGSPLAASLHFAPEPWQDAIVALRAVVSEIAAVPDTVSDADIGRKKLAWWRNALEERAAHPAIEALVASGAADRLAPERFEPLIARVAETLESPRFEQTQEAWNHCVALGGPVARLEAELIEPDDLAAVDWALPGGFAYLVRLVRDLGVDARANRWLVPLDLQAEYQLARQEVVDGSVGRGWDGMVRAWLEDSGRRVVPALEALPGPVRWRQRHLLILHALDRRLARALARHPRRILDRRVRTGQVGNVWQAWREARRLRRLSRN
ncbi:MAG: squalene/phytoene synthase family protein [Gammaproteobacteria bacterium]|jgi:phytoene/squalene synthetase|nr:squalene/phytoene synthase family protein [Gammaproteobacteria bacterium]